MAAAPRDEPERTGGASVMMMVVFASKPSPWRCSSYFSFNVAGVFKEHVSPPQVRLELRQYAISDENSF